MRKVYLSFLGLGQFDRETGEYRYRPAVYELNGRKSKVTRFVQAAEMEILDGGGFDLVLVAATRKSRDAHFENLKAEMETHGAAPKVLILEEEMDSKGQWQWFEKLLCRIEPGDRLTVDLTHGFRAIPIVFSTAINFLQKARNIGLEAVYYGVFEKIKDLGHAPIIDMKDFYLINEWADAVGRLVEDADARKMAEVAEKTADFQAGELNDDKVIGTFEDLTDAIRNVDVNNIAQKADCAVRLIRKKEKSASATGKILLNLVIDKFVGLAAGAPTNKKYDKTYFLVQIEIIRLLLEHKLFMQAYTVMREFIASVAMIPFEKEGMNNDRRKKRRVRYGEIFFQMYQYAEPKWDFGQRDELRLGMMPFYDLLKSNGIGSIFAEFSGKLAKYRNGFDHAWTARSGAEKDIEKFGKDCLNKLEAAMALMIDADVFDGLE